MEKQIHDFIDAHADVVVKPLDGMGGAQVFRVTDADPNRNVIVETLTLHGERSIMAQRYIPEIRAGDKRILLIAGEAVPYSLARIPKAGETRGNLAAGGTGVAQPLSARDLEIADRARPGTGAARPAAGGPGRDRRLPHRNQRHQPDLLSGNPRADRLQRRRAVHRRAGASLRRLTRMLAAVKYQN